MRNGYLSCSSGRRRRAPARHVEITWRICRRFFSYGRAGRLSLPERKGFTTVRNLVFVVYALSQAAATAPLAADTSPLPAPVYTVSRSFPLGGTGDWDYLALEPIGARLFISRGDHVDVVETVSSNLAATIPTTTAVPPNPSPPPLLP